MSHFVDFADLAQKSEFCCLSWRMYENGQPRIVEIAYRNGLWAGNWHCDRARQQFTESDLAPIASSCASALTDLDLDLSWMQIHVIYRSELTHNVYLELARDFVCDLFGKPRMNEAQYGVWLKQRKREQKLARLDHIQSLKDRGPEFWSTLTQQQFELTEHYQKSDLAGANLREWLVRKKNFQKSSFAGADLRAATLSGCKLTGCDFSQANLSDAELSDCRLNQANLTGATLRDANLSRAKLRGALLSGADLRGAKFIEADLRGADLSASQLKGAKVNNAQYDHGTRFPDRFSPPATMKWKGSGAAPSGPALAPTPAALTVETLVTALETVTDASRLKKSLAMLKAERFELFVDIGETQLAGVISSQSDAELIYSCFLGSDGQFSCCTQNLNACGGLRGKLCKHLLVLIIGLAKAEQLPLDTLYRWVDNSTQHKPQLDRDRASDTLLRYKGAQAGEIDWRPTETVPEDFYMF